MWVCVRGDKGVLLVQNLPMCERKRAGEREWLCVCVFEVILFCSYRMQTGVRNGERKKEGGSEGGREGGKDYFFCA